MYRRRITRAGPYKLWQFTHKSVPRTTLMRMQNGNGVDKARSHSVTSTRKTLMNVDFDGDLLHCDGNSQAEDDELFDFCTENASNNQEGQSTEISDTAQELSTEMSASSTDNLSNTESPLDAELNELLYHGSLISRLQLLALTKAFIIKHRLTKAACEDLLTLVNVVVPNSLPATSYLFSKHLYDEQANVRHFVCPSCLSYIGLELGNECADCKLSLNEKHLLENSSYFLTLSLKEQLTHLLNSSESRKLCQFGENRQVTAFNSELNEFLSHKWNISLSCNIDGVPVFKSSNTSLWPILVTVNDVQVQHRKKFIMLHSLWLSPNKPRMDTYLKPFVDDLNHLYNDGVEWVDENGVTQTTKCALTACICDSVARPLVQHFKQFNGEYGCGYCLHPGKCIKKGLGYARIYPLDSVFPAMRTHEVTIADARIAIQNSSPQRGVKGLCPFVELTYFDVINMFPPDYMHSICLGVVRSTIEILLDGGNRMKPFYLGNSVAELDNRMQLQKPPSEITRMPRSFLLRKFWKASEWRSFLLFYSVGIFYQIMTPQCYRHWLLLVCGVHLLLQEELDSSCIKQAHRCFVKFVVQYSHIYGEENVSYNVHLLVHMADYVKLFGPLQRTSAFLFEDACGRLLKAFHGTQGVSQQIAKNFLAQQRLSLLVSDNERSYTEYNSSVDTFSKLCSRVQPIQKAHVLSPGCTAFGLHTPHKLTCMELVALKSCAGDDYCSLNVNNSVRTYDRFHINGHVYTSKKYSLPFKRNDSVVSLGNGIFGCVRHLLTLNCICSCIDSQCVHKLSVETFVIVESFTVSQSKIRDSFVGNNLAHSIYNILRYNEKVLACRPSDIGSKCVLVTNGSTDVVIPLPQFECD